MGELEREIQSLKAQSRSQSLCSVCTRPLESPPQGDSVSRSPSQHDTPESDSASSHSMHPNDESDSTADELSSRFYQLSMKTKYSGSTSSFTLVNNAIAVGTNRYPYFRHSRCIHR